MYGSSAEPQWLTIDEAARHCEAGIGIWDWASSKESAAGPDVVMACAGDVPTLETLAAVALLRAAIPELSVRVVNVVDLLALQSKDQHPHGLTDEAFDRLFTIDRPVIFAYHGYPYLIHRLTYKRTNHENIHVRGFIEEGTTTTPFNMAVLNELDRFLKDKAAAVIGLLQDKLADHSGYIRDYGKDMPEVRDWKWAR